VNAGQDAHQPTHPALKEAPYLDIVDPYSRFKRRGKKCRPKVALAASHVTGMEEKGQQAA